MIFFYLLIFVIIAFPGIYFKGALLSFTDIFLPVMGTIAVGITIKVNKMQKYLFIYIMAIILSIFVAILEGESVEISAIFKALRAIFLVFIFPIVLKYFNREKFNRNRCCIVFLVSGIISSFLGIFLFFIQSELYRAPQTMVFLGKVMYRAGGIFAEAGTFSLMMSLIFIFALECIMEKTYIALAILCAGLALLGIIVSDTRIAVLAISITVIYIILRTKKITMRQVILVVITVFICIVVCLNNTFIQRFINERIMSSFLGFINQTASLNNVSSGRIEIWQNRLNDYFSGDILQIICGNGYKISDMSLADNNYISTLYNVGLIGIIGFGGYWISNILLLRKLKGKQNLFYKVYRDMIITFMVFMMTCDAMTMFRPMYLFALIASINYCYSKRSI